MKTNEAERRKYLALQAFYLEVRRLMEGLEKKLKTKPLSPKRAEGLERKEKANV